MRTSDTSTVLWDRLQRKCGVNPKTVKRKKKKVQTSHQSSMDVEEWTENVDDKFKKLEMAVENLRDA